MAIAAGALALPRAFSDSKRRFAAQSVRRADASAPDCVADQDPRKNRDEAGESSARRVATVAKTSSGPATRGCVLAFPHPRISGGPFASPGGAIRAHGYKRPRRQEFQNAHQKVDSMLTHQEETRVVVAAAIAFEEFDFETASANNCAAILPPR